MNKPKPKGNWKDQNGKFNKKFALLPENGLMFEEGKQEGMFGKL